MKIEPFFPKGVALTVLIAAASVCKIGAQTNVLPATNLVPILTTNFVEVKPWYREVNGQVYDPEHSSRWMTVGGRVTEVLSNAIIVQLVSELPTDYRKVGTVYGRGWHAPEYVPFGEKDVPGATIMLLNHANNSAIVRNSEGVEVPAMQVGYRVAPAAMFVGTTNYNGKVLPLWDCGCEPPSGVLTVVSTNNLPRPKRTE